MIHSSSDPTHTHTHVSLLSSFERVVTPVGIRDRRSPGPLHGNNLLEPVLAKPDGVEKRCLSTTYTSVLILSTKVTDRKEWYDRNPSIFRSLLMIDSITFHVF